MITLFYNSPHFEIYQSTIEEIFFLYEKGEKLLSGRRTAKIIDYKGKKYILKKEVRGGLFSSILTDKFFSLSPFYREIEISSLLSSKDLTIPILLLFGIKKNFLYKVYSLTQYIDDAFSLKDIVLNKNLIEERVIRAGETIAKMHNLGLYHFDLNLGNILFSKDKTYIIDLKNSYFYNSPLNCFLAKKNLLRVFQSYIKETTKENIKCKKDFFKLILNGYSKIRDEKWVKEIGDNNFFLRYKKLVYKVKLVAKK